MLKLILGVLFLSLTLACSAQAAGIPADSNLSFSTLQERAITPTYDSLFRNNESYLGRKVYYEGKIVQIVGSHERYILRVNVTQDQDLDWWSDTVYMDYQGPRLLEDDLIRFVAYVEGLKTYEAVLGNHITVPHLNAIRVLRIHPWEIP